jgi:uncharacterized protein (TIGR00251 family)
VIRVSVHVHPGSKAPGVGGDYAGALIVRTRARAVNGRANEEVRKSLAEAFGVRTSEVELVRGATSRHKFVEVRGDERRLGERLKELLVPPLRD